MYAPPMATSTARRSDTARGKCFASNTSATTPSVDVLRVHESGGVAAYVRRRVGVMNTPRTRSPTAPDATYGTRNTAIGIARPARNGSASRASIAKRDRDDPRRELTVRSL